MKKKWIFIQSVLFAVLVAGYFWRDYISKHSEEALLRRANQYWEAIKLNDLVTAYKLEAETVNGGLLPHDVELKHDWGIRIVNFKLGSVQYFDDYATIELSTEITLPDSTKTRNRRPVEDVWTFTKGQWFHGTVGGSMMRRRSSPKPGAAPWNPFVSD